MTACRLTAAFRSVIIAVVITAGVILATAGATATAQAHPGKPTWSPSYTESRVIGKRFVDKDAIWMGQSELTGARERLAFAQRDGDIDEIISATARLGWIESFIESAKAGWPVRDVRCVGVGRPNRHYRFAHIRCGVLVRVESLPGIVLTSEEVWPSNVLYFTAHPITRLRFAITNKRWS